MSYRLLAFCAGLLLCVGCQKTTPSPAPSGETPPSPSAAPAASVVVPADPAAPVATLLGKSVYRRDFSGDGNPAQAEVNFRRLILSALMDDFCRREVAALSQEEIDAFWEVLQSAAERSSGKKPPVREFDEAKIQAQLDEMRGKLANKDARWLERLQLEGLARSLEFALQHKSVAAHEAYNQLMPLRCQKALYEKYGGKVVGMQISIEPVGAYQKLIEEAEASGQLKFHDTALEQSFRRHMNKYASRQEVPPESVDFSLPAWLQVALRRPANSSTAPRAQPAAAPPTTGTTTAPRRNDPDMLTHFVGVWQTRSTDKPAKWKPDGGESTVHEVTQWALKNRIILGREHDQTDGRKSLWVMTYDQQKNVYPFWMFDSREVTGGQWQLTWDAAKQTATGHATDTPAGWTSHGTNQFPDGATNNVHYWMKDESGTLLMEANATKRRQPDEAGAAYLAAWSKSDPQDALPAELKPLDRMIGDWDAVATMKPAEWTPAGGQSTMKIKRQWILNGRFVMDTPIHSNGQEGLTIIGFDPNQKVYQGWRFNSEGEFPHVPFQGSWNATSQTLSYVGQLEDGKTNRTSVRLSDRNREVWQIKVTDADGKVYFDVDIIATRRTAARENGAKPEDKQPRPTDQSKLQGTWGAIAFLQDGQRGDEPIAPEEAAIKYIFKGEQFTLLASGNAGETPKGSFKLGSRGKAKTIDLVFPPESNGAEGQTMSGVYELDSDTLKITFAKQGAIIFKRIKQ